MKSGRPSRTADLVTFARALADAGLSHVPDFRDPTARVFLREKAKQRLDRVIRGAGKPSAGAEAYRRMADHMALRTSAIDGAVRDALAAGATQLVILGAGYDGRAWRMPELAGRTVFEVDHPATQGVKRSHLAELPAAAGDVHLVSIDFESDALEAVLERAGHDPSTPTCWIWEGVVMYLTRPAMRATLAGIAHRSAPGSTLIVNYHTVLRGFFAALVFRLLGEPQISAWTPAEMAADLASAGFTVHEDSGMLDWNQRFAGGEARVERSAYMRVVVARNGLV